MYVIILSILFLPSLCNLTNIYVQGVLPTVWLGVMVYRWLYQGFKKISEAFWKI